MALRKTAPHGDFSITKAVSERVVSTVVRVCPLTEMLTIKSIKAALAIIFADDFK